MNPERIDELIALAVLGELSPDDERELNAARRADPVVAADLDEALATAAVLQRAHHEPPPAGLRADVMAAIASVPQDAPADEPVALDAARTRRRRRSSVLLAAAAVIVFVVGAFVVANDVAAPDGVAAVLDAADAERHSVSGELGMLVVTYSPSEEAMVVAGEGIVSVAENMTYQVWFEREGTMVPAGLFRPDDEGHVEELITVDAGTGESINVTAEPAGGSETPTLPVLATSA